MPLKDRSSKLVDLLLPLQEEAFGRQVTKKTYLVKCGLRNGVVFNVESLLVLGENTEYSGQGRW